jgi:hypothetical protein
MDDASFRLTMSLAWHFAMPACWLISADGSGNGGDGNGNGNGDGEDEGDGNGNGDSKDEGDGNGDGDGEDKGDKVEVEAKTSKTPSLIET